MSPQQLIEDNMKLVYFILSHEYPTYLKDEDIIQSGMLGLCKAANTWKHKGLFSTYAGRCIRNEIRQEFVKRKRHYKSISLESTVNDDSTLGDLIIGAEDIEYLDDDSFYSHLTGEECNILKMNNMGFSSEEISKMSGYSVQKVQKILRTIRIKWRNFCGN